MLPDFPRQKAHFAKRMSQLIAEKIRRNPLLGLIPIHSMREGRAVEVESPGGFKHLTDIAEASFMSSVAEDDLIKKGPTAYLEQVDAIAERFIEAQHRMLASTVTRVTDEAGMTIDAKGQPFSVEQLIEGLERMSLPFDEKGAPKLPTIVAHPVLAAKIRQEMESLESNPDLKRRYDAAIEAKRQEWLARENNRTLVD